MCCWYEKAHAYFLTQLPTPTRLLQAAPRLPPVPSPPLLAPSRSSPLSPSLCPSPRVHRSPRRPRHLRTATVPLWPHVRSRRPWPVELPRDPSPPRVASAARQAASAQAAPRLPRCPPVPLAPTLRLALSVAPPRLSNSALAPTELQSSLLVQVPLLPSSEALLLSSSRCTRFPPHL